MNHRHGVCGCLKPDVVVKAWNFTRCFNCLVFLAFDVWRVEEMINHVSIVLPPTKCVYIYIYAIIHTYMIQHFHIDIHRALLRVRDTLHSMGLEF